MKGKVSFCYLFHLSAGCMFNSDSKFLEVTSVNRLPAMTVSEIVEVGYRLESVNH